MGLRLSVLGHRPRRTIPGTMQTNTIQQLHHVPDRHVGGWRRPFLLYNGQDVHRRTVPQIDGDRLLRRPPAPSICTITS